MNSNLLVRWAGALGFLFLALAFVLIGAMLIGPMVLWNMSRGTDVPPLGFAWGFVIFLLAGISIFRSLRRMWRIINGTIPAWSWPTYVAYGIFLFLAVQFAVAFPAFHQGLHRMH